MAKPPVRRRPEKGHVLLIEDDRILGEILQGFLQHNCGTTVHWAETAADAVNHLDKHGIGLIVSDVRFPSAAGKPPDSASGRLIAAHLELIRQKSGKKIPVVLHSTALDLAPDEIGKFVVHRVKKGAALQDLAALVNTHLGQKGK